MDKGLTSAQKDAIREGIKSEGFPKFIVDSLRISEYGSQHKTRAFTLTLEFHADVVLDDEVIEHSLFNPFGYVGRRFAKELQMQLARLLPEGYIENKVVLPVKEYDNLRRRALSLPASSMFDFEFGTAYGAPQRGTGDEGEEG